MDDVRMLMEFALECQFLPGHRRNRISVKFPLLPSSTMRGAAFASARSNTPVSSPDLLSCLPAFRIQRPTHRFAAPACLG